MGRPPAGTASRTAWLRARTTPAGKAAVRAALLPDEDESTFIREAVRLHVQRRTPQRTAR